MDEIQIEYEKAIDAFSQGKPEEAAAMLEALTRRVPSYADAYETLGMLYYRMGRLDEAIAWTEKLTGFLPGHAIAHTNLSIFYMKKGMKEKAEEEKAKATVLRFSGPEKKS